ncbi:hypothetical protein RHSIM_Rhsim03G0242000 [Rhododendron simsii]|uniref:Aminoacyl-tRNA synthetase class Ia domain-containing protein n=1 Tax=Rhododendron simsii TaxID=118357 RepID=A0A834LSP6_RHOSS|nr:hypothetical protein RHSIM_Rhsim03G0242000 [Rhododendron simsii]
MRRDKEGGERETYGPPFGWDCHGLSVEFEIDTKLGIKTRDDVLKMGIGNYNEECRSIVTRYVGEWEKVVARTCPWIDFKNDYETMDLKFMESVWWVFPFQFVAFELSNSCKHVSPGPVAEARRIQLRSGVVVRSKGEEEFRTFWDLVLRTWEKSKRKKEELLKGGGYFYIYEAKPSHVMEPLYL